MSKRRIQAFRAERRRAAETSDTLLGAGFMNVVLMYVKFI